jgi:hypothetical protein
MNPAKLPSERIPIIYLIILGFSIGWGGMVYTFISAMCLWVWFNRALPRVDSELVLTASVMGGKLVALLISMLLQPQLQGLESCLETPAVAGMAILLLFTQRRWLAFILVVYLAVYVFLGIRYALLHLAKGDHPEHQLANVPLSIILLFLLVRWLRKEPGDNRG